MDAGEGLLRVMAGAFPTTRALAPALDSTQPLYRGIAGKPDVPLLLML